MIYNPASKGGKSKHIVDKVCKFLDDRNVNYGYAETKAPLDAINQVHLAKEEGYDTVCSIGGDGTAHEVANGAIQTGMKFSLIPAGSGNDFAKAIGLNGNWEEAAEVLLNGKETDLSIVKVGNRYSINVVDAGLGGKVAKLSMSKLKWLGGSIKYTLLMVRALFSHKPYPCTLKLDGQEYNYDVNMIIAGFGQTFGSGMRILPDARFTNEEMDVAVIHSASRLTILRVFPKVFSGKHVNYDKYVTMLKGNELEVLPNGGSDREMLSQAEGEVVGSAPLTFKSVPKGLRAIIPSHWNLNSPTLWAKE